MNRYLLQKSTTLLGWWTCTDTENKLVCRFQEHDFNGTQKFTPLDDTLADLGANGVAKVCNELAQWLLANHSDLLFPPGGSLLDSLLARAHDTVTQWVTDNWRRPIGEPDGILEDLIMYDDEFSELWELICDDHGWDEEIDPEHPDYIQLLDVIAESQRQASVSDHRQRIGEMVRQARQAAGLTIRQLAEKSGYTAQNITKIENGKYNVSIDILSRILAALEKKITIVDEDS